MANYPWDYPVCSLAGSKSSYEATKFERSLSKDSRRWREIFDESSGHIIGYIRSSNGFTEAVDRNGKRLFSSEIPIENSIISPIDFVGLGTGRLAIGVTKLISRSSIALGRGGLISLKSAIKGMRSVANSIIKEASTSASKGMIGKGSTVVAKITERQVAKNIMKRVQEEIGRVIVNIGGTGEVAGAINLNPLLAQQTRSVPNLIKAAGEKIGKIFPASSVDELISNNIVHGTISWKKALTGAFKAMKSGGRVSIAPFPGGNMVKHIAEIGEALKNAGFREVKVIGEKIVQAIK